MLFTIVILDYCLNQVRVYHFNNKDRPKDAEEWVHAHDPNWNDANCYFMAGENTVMCHMDNKTGACLVEDLL